jgi:hypothetical protein
MPQINIPDMPKDFANIDYPNKDFEGNPIQRGFYVLRDSSDKIIPGSIAHIREINYQFEDPRTDYGISTQRTGLGIYKLLTSPYFQRCSKLTDISSHLFLIKDLELRCQTRTFFEKTCAIQEGILK